MMKAQLREPYMWYVGFNMHVRHVDYGNHRLDCLVLFLSCFDPMYYSLLHHLHLFGFSNSTGRTQVLVNWWHFLICCVLPPICTTCTMCYWPRPRGSDSWHGHALESDTIVDVSDIIVCLYCLMAWKMGSIFNKKNYWKQCYRVGVSLASHN